MSGARPGPAVRRGLAAAERVVVKVGSGLIAGDGTLSDDALRRLAADVIELRRAGAARGCEVILVVSGAVAAGYQDLGHAVPPREVVERQAAASIGQPTLMAAMSAAFAAHGATIAQLLLSAEDIEHRRRFLSARHTILRLLEHGVVPVVNENDALSDDEIKVGDNDHLAALVTNLVSADLLVLLSTVSAFHEDGGRGARIAVVDAASDLDHHIDRVASPTGIGGMTAKVAAARLAARSGVPTVIAGGRDAGVLRRIHAGDDVGTLFPPASSKLTARKRWIAVRSRSRGAIRVDEGARNAIVGRQASLLPSGVIGVDGDFSMGARVDIADAAGAPFAVGLVSYAAGEIRRMQGRRASEFEDVLGYRYVDEIVGRDDLVILDVNGSASAGVDDA